MRALRPVERVAGGGGPPSPSAAQDRSAHHRHERGSGVVGTTAGIVVVVAFLLLGLHVLVRLHAASLTGSAALAGAREVATSGSDLTDPAAAAATTAAADATVRDLLGEVGDTAELDWSGTTAAEVVLRVRVDVPDVLPAGAAGALPFDVVERTARVRIEAPR